jgi:thiol-disulfide isomerase/thioredoxin
MKRLNFRSLISAFTIALLHLLSSVQSNAQQSVPVYTSFDQLQTRIAAGGDALFIINFWATWCKPCIEELPHFQTLHEQLDPNKKIKILLVSLDFKSQLERRLVPFIKERNLKPEVVVLADPDANSWIPKVDAKWDGAIPATLYVQGKKRYFDSKAYQSPSEIELVLKWLK